MYIADQLGYVDYKLIATDGTKIKANACAKFTGTITDFERRSKRLEENIILAIEKQKSTDKREEKEYWAKKQDRYQKNKTKIDVFLQKVKPVYSKKGKEIKQNITDSDCRIMRTSGTYTESYNANTSVCAKNSIIIGADVTSIGDDKHMFKRMVEEVKENVPNKKDISCAKHLNDAGYYSVDNIVWADQKNIDVYIPDCKDKKNYIDTEERSKGQLISQAKCTFVKRGNEVDVYCKKGNVLLKKVGIRNIRGDDYIVFRPKSHDCEVCKYYKECTGKLKERNKTFTINKNVYENCELIKKYFQKLTSDEGRIIYSNRMPTIEKIFGHLKKNTRFRSFNVIGMEKVKTIWKTVCTSYNLKRIFNLEKEKTAYAAT